MFRRILICTDLTDGLQRLISTVNDLQQIGVSQVVFAHCVPFAEESDIPHPDEKAVLAAQRCLDPAIAGNLSGIDLHIEIGSGKPEEWLPSIAAQYRSELLVLGTPPRSFLVEKLFGSTSAALAQRCHLPLLALRPPLIQVYRQDELSLRCQNLFRELWISFDSMVTGQLLVDYLTHTLAQHWEQNLEQDAASDRPIAIDKCWLVAIVAQESRRFPNDHKIQEAQTYLEGFKTQLSSYGVAIETQIYTGQDWQDILSLTAGSNTESNISAICVTANRGEEIGRAHV